MCQRQSFSFLKNNLSLFPYQPFSYAQTMLDAKYFFTENAIDAAYSWLCM